MTIFANIIRCRYITISLKNEEPRYVEEFVNRLDTRDDQVTFTRFRS